MTGVFGGGDAEFEGAAERGLTPCGWGDLVGVCTGGEKAVYFGGVAGKAGVVEELPLHGNQNNLGVGSRRGG